MSITSDDIALRLGDQDVFSCYMHDFIENLIPPPVHLQRLTANVRPMDVPTVVADLKTFIFADGLQDKPNSVSVLRALNDRLSSFAHLIPRGDLSDGVVVPSLQDALARVHIPSSCPYPSGLPSGGAFARQFAYSIAAVQHILDDVLANANDFDQQERVIKEVLRAKSSLLVHCLTKAPTASTSAGVPLLWKNSMPSTMLLLK
jgi:hypothetical protein